MSESKDAYLRCIIGGPRVCQEWRDGAPTILFESQPLHVVRRLASGRLEGFFHHKSEMANQLTD